MPFCWVEFYSATSSPVFGGKINIPPPLLVTYTCSFFTRRGRSRISRAADIALRAPKAEGSSRTSTIPNAAFGAFIASIIPVRSVIFSFNGPTTSANLVVREYPEISMAALMSTWASPSRASRKPSYLGVRDFVITVYFSVDLHYDKNVLLRLFSLIRLSNMKEKFEIMLSGGRPNSLGRTLEVVDIILNDEGSLDYLFECYSTDDATVRLRVSNAFKRIFRQKPNWFVGYVDKFQSLVPTLNQPSAEWTLAQLHLEFFNLLNEEQKSKAIDISREQLRNSKDWIVIIQNINFLEKVAEEDESLRHWLLTKLNLISKDSRKAVSKKAAEIHKSLSP